MVLSKKQLKAMNRIAIGNNNKNNLRGLYIKLWGLYMLELINGLSRA